MYFPWLLLGTAEVFPEEEDGVGRFIQLDVCVYGNTHFIVFG
jgi:hypothetical protein